MKITEYSKALVPIVVAALSWVATQLGLDPGIVTPELAAGITSVLVYLIPNKKA